MSELSGKVVDGFGTRSLDWIASVTMVIGWLINWKKNIEVKQTVATIFNHRALLSFFGTIGWKRVWPANTDSNLLITICHFIRFVHDKWLAKINSHLLPFDIIIIHILRSVFWFSLFFSEKNLNRCLLNGSLWQWEWMEKTKRALAHNTHLAFLVARLFLFIIALLLLYDGRTNKESLLKWI